MRFGIHCCVLMIVGIKSDSVPTIFSDALSRQNFYRAKHLSPILIWNNTLSNESSAWASKCNPVNDYAGSTNLEGQNVYSATFFPPISTFVVQAADVWYYESSFYSNFSKPNVSSATADFTQMIWKDTRSVGCAFASCPPVGLVCCRYFPAGNIPGRYQQEVLPPYIALVYVAPPTPPPLGFASTQQPATQGSISGGAIAGYFCVFLLFGLLIVCVCYNCRSCWDFLRTYNVLLFE